MDHKADSRFLSPWFFLMIGMVSVCIIIGVSVFYGQSQDVRLYHASVLAYRLHSTVIIDGYLLDGVLDPAFDLSTAARLDKTIFSSTGNYFYQLNVYRGSGTSLRPLHAFSDGNIELFDIECSLESDYFARCYTTTYPVVSRTGEVYSIRVISAVRGEDER